MIPLSIHVHDAAFFVDCFHLPRHFRKGAAAPQRRCPHGSVAAAAVAAFVVQLQAPIPDAHVVLGGCVSTISTSNNWWQTVADGCHRSLNQPIHLPIDSVLDGNKGRIRSKYQFQHPTYLSIHTNTTTTKKHPQIESKEVDRGSGGERVGKRLEARNAYQNIHFIGK
jgi:hypothetical protein